MVEINNQRKAFLDMLAWSEGTDNGASENQKSWCWRHCRRRAIYWLLDHLPRKLVTSLKTQINRRRTLPASFPLVGCLYHRQRPERLLSEKSGRCGITARLRSVALYHDWSWWYPSGNRPLQQYLGFTAGLVMVSSSIRLTAWLQKFKEAGGTVRDWCMSRVAAIISALVITIIVCLSWAVNHYRDNAVPTKPARQKCQRTEAGRHDTDMQVVSVMLLRSMQNTKELADAKAENDVVMMLPLVVVGCTSKRSVSRCVKPPPPAWIIQPPPTGRHRWTGLFHPQEERLVTVTLEGTQKYINEQCR